MRLAEPVRQSKTPALARSSQKTASTGAVELGIRQEVWETAIVPPAREEKTSCLVDLINRFRLATRVSRRWALFSLENNAHRFFSSEVKALNGQGLRRLVAVPL